MPQDLVLYLITLLILFKINIAVIHNSTIISFKYLFVIFFYISLFAVEVNPDALKAKKSELRLYCDLLMQQVHLIKTASKSEKPMEFQVE